MERFVYTLGPFAAVMAGLWIVHSLEGRRRESRAERPPIREKLLRCAGHSARVKAGELYETATERGVVCLCAATALGYYLSRGPLQGGENVATALVLAVVVIGAFASVFHPLKKARSYRLGARGEEFMGEELAKVMPAGYRVFHDVPGGPDWNLDHVAVGPGGVFAIETKTRRRREPLPHRKENEVVFNGEELQFAWFNDRDSIGQARRNAESLAKFLTSSTGERVEAKAILALPGWWVTLRAKCDVAILSGRQVAGFIRGCRPILEEARIQRIAHQLDQKCRDVEF